MDPIVLSTSNDLLAVSKPPGWLTVPGRHHPGPVLGAWLEKKFCRTLYPIHRLDVETSGLVLFACTADAHRTWNQYFLKREIEKTYLCLIEGELPAPIVKLNSPINGQAAHTRIVRRWTRARPPNAAVTFCEAYPKTGRRHQIRIHLQSLGTPILGDRTYGATLEPGFSVPRVALHSYRLKLKTASQLSFEAPPWSDFQTWTEALAP